MRPTVTVTNPPNTVAEARHVLARPDESLDRHCAHDKIQTNTAIVTFAGRCSRVPAWLPIVKTSTLMSPIGEIVRLRSMRCTPPSEPPNRTTTTSPRRLRVGPNVSRTPPYPDRSDRYRRLSRQAGNSSRTDSTRPASMSVVTIPGPSSVLAIGVPHGS